MITGLLGGRTSEEIFFDDVSSGASNDIQRATRLARSMVTEYGMSDLGPIQYEDASGSVFLGRDYANASKNFSTQIAFEIDKAVREIIDSCHEEAKRIILEHKAEVTLIAETLLEKETITAEEIQSLVQNGRLPEKKVAKIHETDVISAEERERINKVASTPGKRDIEQGSVETTPKVEESPSKPVNLEKTDDSEQK
jgi:cell division protease FtsH